MMNGDELGKEEEIFYPFRFYKVSVELEARLRKYSPKIIRGIWIDLPHSSSSANDDIQWGGIGMKLGRRGAKIFVCLVAASSSPHWRMLPINYPLVLSKRKNTIFRFLLKDLLDK